WVREKIYNPAHDGHDPSYRRYHAEPFAGHNASCWEKHEMQREVSRITAYAAYRTSTDISFALTPHARFSRETYVVQAPHERLLLNPQKPLILIIVLHHSQPWSAEMSSEIPCGMWTLRRLMILRIWPRSESEKW